MKSALWTYSVVATDPDGDDVFYRLGQAPVGMSIDRTTGLLRWTPTETSSGVIVEVVAEDVHGAWSMQSFDLPVVERLNNATPVFTSIPIGPAQVGSAWSYSAVAFDPDGDTLTYALDAAALAAGLTLNSVTGSIAWTPRTAGEQRFTVTASDGYGGTASQTVNLPVIPPQNDPPRFVSVPTGPAIVGTAWSYAARAIDPEGDALRYSLGSTTPSSVSIDAISGRVTYTATAAGSITITIIATDTAGNTAQQQFTLPAVAPSSNNTNRPPLFTSSPTGPARIDQTWIYVAVAIDPDGDAVTYALDSAALAAGVSIDSSSGRVTWTPRSAGAQTIEVQARDSAGNMAIQRFDLIAVRDNRPPSIDSQPTGPLTRGRPWTYTIITSDPDGDTVSLALDAASLARGMTLSGNRISWTPTTSGNFSLTITASDGRGGQATQFVQLVVRDTPPPSGNPPRFRSLHPKKQRWASR